MTLPEHPIIGWLLPSTRLMSTTDEPADAHPAPLTMASSACPPLSAVHGDVGAGVGVGVGAGVGLGDGAGAG